ncbi:MAG: winged helix-turn-helix domain-containing protein [Armatimonadota bacterium]
MSPTVLLAANESDRWDVLESSMRSMHLCVRRVATGEEAVLMHERIGASLVLIAIDLPDVHALDVCRRIRRGSDVPLIVLSDEGADLDRVLALELGADDVVSGDCDRAQLQERVKAALRRGTAAQMRRTRGEVLEFGSVSIDRSTRTLIVDGERHELTPMETELLWMLGQHAGEVVESGEILESVWGYPRDINTRTVDVHIGRLRKKLGEDGRNPRRIITVRSVGYRFEPPEGAALGESRSAV